MSHDVECSCCNGESQSARDLRIAERVREGTVMVIAVADHDSNAGNFAYTVGMAQHGLPELIAIGALPQKVLYVVVDSMAHKAVENKHLESRLYNDVLKEHHGVTMNVEVVDIDQQAAIDEYMGIAVRVHRLLAMPSFSVKQVLFPDAQGRVPTEMGYDQNHYPQPSLRITRQ